MNIQKTLAAALFGAGMFAAGFAQAYTDLGTLSSAPTTGNGGYAASGFTFADEYKFHISTPSTVGGAVNEFNLFGYNLLSGWTVNLFDGSHMLLDSNTVYDPSNSFSASGFFTSGDYFVEIAGTTGATGGAYSYSLSAVPAPVPEPGEFALLLSGLGLMGYMVRRRRNDAA